MQHCPCSESSSVALPVHPYRSFADGSALACRTAQRDRKQRSRSVARVNVVSCNNPISASYISVESQGKNQISLIGANQTPKGHAVKARRRVGALGNPINLDLDASNSARPGCGPSSISQHLSPGGEVCDICGWQSLVLPQGAPSGPQPGPSRNVQCREATRVRPRCRAEGAACRET